MLTMTKIALAAALIFGSASVGAVSALAADNNSGEYSGGFVVPGSSAVNPTYHPRWSGTQIKGGEAFGYVAPRANTLRTAPAEHEDNYGSEATKD
jgi:hypothetical protein